MAYVVSSAGVQVKIAAKNVDEAIAYVNSKGWTIRYGPYDTGQRISSLMVFTFGLSAPVPVVQPPVTPPYTPAIPYTPAKPPAPVKKTWAQMTEDEKKGAVQDALRNATASDKNKVITQIEGDLSVDNATATKYYQMASGQALPIGPFDLLDFTIVGGLLASSATLLYKATTNILLKSIGKEAAETGTKIIAKTAAESAAKVATKDITEAILKNPGKAVSTIEKLGATETVEVMRELSRTDAGRKITTSVWDAWLTTSTKGAAKITEPGVSKGILATLKADVRAHPLFTLLGISFLLTQMDVLGWGFGLLPQPIHSKAETTTKAIRGDLIRLDDLTKNKSWSDAALLATQIKAEIKAGRANLEGAPIQFWQKFGFTFDDARAMFDTLETTLDTYLNQFPAITKAPIVWPEEITLTNVNVEDGDTLEFPGHPEVMNKIRIQGIDTHEAGTAAGEIETAYAKTLLQGKTVTVKIDPYDQIDIYGRLLGVVLVDGKDYGLIMLQKFGKDILTAKTYQKKEKYIDWNEYAAAAAMFAGVTGTLKIYSKPTYASIWIDGKDTGKIAIETFKLPEGSHVITLKKAGYYDTEETVNITAGQIVERRYEMTATALGGITPTEKITTAVGVTAGPVFAILIESEPSNAKLYIDNVYTHHLTPSDATELKDVISLLKPGKHKIKATRTDKGVTYSGEVEVNITDGDNGAVKIVIEGW